MAKLVRRTGSDRSQALRHAFQSIFLALNVWIGVEFWMFVRYYETGGRTAFASRPPGVEGWLPIASLMNLKVLVETGHVPLLHPAGLFLLIAFLVCSWIFRKSFCGWLCPVGTVSEALWNLAGLKKFSVPRWLDVTLRAVKYLLLGLFAYAVASMPVPAIRAFLGGPYGMVDDVKMLNFFRFIGLGGATVIGFLIVASLVIRNFWCRYLCPYGALMGLAALASPLRIRRDVTRCIDCGKCARACPAYLPVDKLIQVRSAECTGCLECVAECPADGALFLGAPARRRVPAWLVAAGVAAIFLGVCGYARANGLWRTDLPSHVYFELVPHANEFTHP
jgi:polyferredoxin